MDVSEDVVRAAGGLVWRPAEDGHVELVLVHRPAYDDWAFPKGKLQRGETEPEAALREVEEETGLRCRLGRELGISSYRDARGRQKTVRFWEMTPVGGVLAPANEVDDARWVRLAEVRDALSYPRDRELLGRFEETRRPPPSVTTTPIFLVRHAKAGKRDEWTEPDLLRPLTKAGWRQAEALVEVIGRPLSRLVSSPYVRCVQTLEPLAAAQGLALETADELSEGAPIEGALTLMRSLAADSGAAALCTHGDVMTLAVEELLASGLPLAGPLKFEKGSTWILEIGDGAFVRGRYVPPP